MHVIALFRASGLFSHRIVMKVGHDVYLIRQILVRPHIRF